MDIPTVHEHCGCFLNRVPEHYKDYPPNTTVSLFQNYHLCQLTLLILWNERTTIWKFDFGQLVFFKVTDLAMKRVSLCILDAKELA